MAYGGNSPRLFKPKNPKKYVGDVNNIVFRSSWEKIFMAYCDNSKDIETWGSELFSIEYVSPKDGKIHRYFPDFILKTTTGRKIIVEIKPYAMSVKPKTDNRRFMLEYAVNMAKWEAAKKLVESQGFEFVVMTEYDLGIKER